MAFFAEGVAAQRLERDLGQFAPQAGYAGVHVNSSLVPRNVPPFVKVDEARCSSIGPNTYETGGFVASGRLAQFNEEWLGEHPHGPVVRVVRQFSQATAYQLAHLP
ncbi:hypothetical protein [Streptomyces lunaelactis]|uniref:hypothetical protein n=1 Tax=Streptomyces lunaelactis TaxID=1535768 RepID=UPI00211D861F|nr:hypothetical protein [Streptomyces lunaelactis]